MQRLAYVVSIIIKTKQIVTYLIPFHQITDIRDEHNL